MKFLKIILPISIILFLSYFAIKSFFISGFFPIHDDTQVARVFEMHKSLSDGMFPVRWVSDLGYNYGYPIFNFYAPLAYYIGGIFMFFGFNALIATKIMMVLGIALAGIFMYFLAKQFWGIGGGLISAVLYLYAPYHALDIYVRGDVAEFYAYAFVPLAFYGLWKSYKSKKWIYVAVGSMGYAGVILSHNLTALMVTPFLLLFILVIFVISKNKIPFILYALYFILLGLSLSAFYWLPVFAEMKYTNVLSQVGGGADYKDHFVCLAQLWDSPWGFGGSTHSCFDGLSYKIGKLHIIFSLFAIITLFVFRKSNKEKFAVTLFTAFSLLFSIFLMLGVSKFLWDIVGPMAFFQYPWRFLLAATFFISFLGGAFGWVLFKLKLPYLMDKFAIASIVLAIVFFNLELFVPQTIFGKTSGNYTNSYELHWTTSKISDEYMPINFYKPKNPNEIPENKLSNNQNNIQIISLTEKTNSIHAEVTAEQKQDMIINLAYFPAWHVYIDGKEVAFKHINKGLIINIPPGKHNIEIKFIQTPIEKLANGLSIAGILLLIIGIISKRKEQKHA